MIENLKELVPYNILIGEPDNPDTHLVEIGEEWKPIVGYEDRYAISSFGRIKSLYREYIQINKKGGISNKITNERLLKGSLNQGYLMFQLKRDKEIFNTSIHRLVGANFIPNPANKPQINHKNGVKTNNKIINLEWCTSSENMKHAFKNGLNKVSDKARRVTSERSKQNTGSKNPNSIKVIDTSTNIVYDCIQSAAHYLGIHQSTLVKYLNGNATNKTSFTYFNK